MDPTPRVVALRFRAQNLGCLGVRGMLSNQCRVAVKVWGRGQLDRHGPRFGRRWLSLALVRQTDKVPSRLINN